MLHESHEETEKPSSDPLPNGNGKALRPESLYDAYLDMRLKRIENWQKLAVVLIGPVAVQTAITVLQWIQHRLAQ